MAEKVLTKIVVYHLPDRAKPCLCLQQGGLITVLATFRNKKCEDLFYDFLGGNNCMQREMRRIFEDGGGEE